jgi:hypothetical protein
MSKANTRNPITLPPGKIALVTGAIFLLAICSYWLSRQMEWKTETYYTSGSREARQNNFLAAQQFLARQSVESENLRSFAPLDQLSWQGKSIGPQDTLILVHHYKVLQGQRLQKLMDWVDAGGTLIVSTDNPFMGSQGSADPLLESLGINTYPDTDEDPFIYDEDEYEDEESADTDEADQNKDEEASEQVKTDEHPVESTRQFRCNLIIEPIPVSLRNESEPLAVDYSEVLGFDFDGPEPRLWAGDDDGVYLALFERGQGRILVNADNLIWSNQRIDCHDHAYLLWKLVNPQGRVWFLMNQESSPSLWTKLWQATPLGASAALLALFFWLWANSRRFGPILTRPQQGRRSLAEHFHASAQLLWRRRQHPYLVRLLREQLLRDLQQQIPDFDTWKLSAKLDYLVQISGLPREQIKTALLGQELQHPQAFTQAIACLQTLRKYL